MSNEITKINELTVEYTFPTIEYDIEPLKNEVTELQNKYKDMVILPFNIPTMKKEIADLSKFGKALDSKRKDIAKAIKEPITQFESDMKDIKKQIDETYRGLKDQIDEYQNGEKEKKRKEILELDSWHSLYMVFDEKWLSTNYSMKKITEDIDKQRQIYDNNIVMIEATCTMLDLKKQKYIEMLNNKADITEIISLIENDKQVKESYSDEPAKKSSITKEDMADSMKYTFTLKLTGNRVQLNALKDYLKENKIEYEKL